MASPQELRKRNRREVTGPSGETYIIRKLTQRDFMPRGLVALVVQEGIKLTQESISDYVDSHVEELEEVEQRILKLGVVSPLVVLDPSKEGTNAIYFLDLGEDKDYLLKEIATFSGLSLDALSQIDKFRGPKLDDIGADGPILSSASS
jgi:hypothetical protein